MRTGLMRHMSGLFSRPFQEAVVAECARLQIVRCDDADDIAVYEGAGSGLRFTRKPEPYCLMILWPEIAMWDGPEVITSFALRMFIPTCPMGVIGFSACSRD